MPAESAESLRLTAGGVAEDFRSREGDGAVSLLSAGVRAWMEGLETPGLCFSKFQENLLLRGVELSALRPGDRLRVGEEALLSLTAVGKGCHPGCALHETTTPCLLKSGAALAVVLQCGVVRVGDQVTVPAKHPAGPPPAP